MEEIKKNEFADEELERISAGAEYIKENDAYSFTSGEVISYNGWTYTVIGDHFNVGPHQIIPVRCVSDTVNTVSTKEAWFLYAVSIK